MTTTPTPASTTRDIRNAAGELVAIARTPASQQSPAPESCTVPPEGWYCTRAAGHEGPCAAVPSDDADNFTPEQEAIYQRGVEDGKLVARGMARLAAGMDKRKAESPARSDKDAEWLPTAENVNALPEGVRRFVHDLATRCDPAGDVAALTGLRDQLDGVQIMYHKAAYALEEVRGCFRAAEVEGLSAALAETTDERLKDLVERRLMYALYAAQGTPAAKAQESAPSSTIDGPEFRKLLSAVLTAYIKSESIQPYITALVAYIDARRATAGTTAAPSVKSSARLLGDLGALLPSDFMWGDSLQAATLVEILDAYDSQRATAGNAEISKLKE